MKIEVYVELGTGEPVIVTVECDAVALALRYARRAYKSKGKRVTLANKSIKVSVRDNPRVPAERDPSDNGHGGMQ